MLGDLWRLHGHWRDGTVMTRLGTRIALGSKRPSHPILPSVLLLFTFGVDLQAVQLELRPEHVAQLLMLLLFCCNSGFTFGLIPGHHGPANDSLHGCADTAIGDFSEPSDLKTGAENIFQLIT